MNNKVKHFCLLPITIFCYWSVAVFAADAPATQATEQAQAMGDPAAVIGQVVMGLVFVTGLIFALGWAVKRLGLTGLSGHKNMRVVSSLAVGGRERVVLIDVAGEKILLGISPGRVNYLQSIHADFETSLDPSSSDANRITGQASSHNAATTNPISKNENDFSAYLKNILSPGNK